MRAKENSIDGNVCIKCGRCVAICPNLHLALEEGKIVEKDQEAFPCIHCAHCMSVCPTQAITIKGYDYDEFDELPDYLPGLEKFEELLKGRRSCRRFQGKPVPREVLEKIVKVASMAPMAIPPWKVEIVVFDSPKKVKEIVAPSMVQVKQWVSGMEYPIGRFFMRFMMTSDQIEQYREIIPLAKNMVEAHEKGQDFLLYDAPAMLLFHAARTDDSFEENCILAKTYAMIAAEGLGLGSTIIGFIPPVFKYDKDLKAKYAIPDENDVVGCLVLGYPKASHNRSIPRDFKSVRWV